MKCHTNVIFIYLFMFLGTASLVWATQPRGMNLAWYQSQASEQCLLGDGFQCLLQQTLVGDDMWFVVALKHSNFAHLYIYINLNLFICMLTCM